MEYKSKNPRIQESKNPRIPKDRDSAVRQFLEPSFCKKLITHHCRNVCNKIG